MGEKVVTTVTNRYTELPDTFFTQLNPTPFAKPRLVALNQDAVAMVGYGDISHEDWAEYGCGKRMLPGSVPAAFVYAGHQFGQYVSQLGDGRAMLLQEVKTPADGFIELQLKGSGKTPYSRFGDGRAVLRSSIREYLCSEAMYHLGIPTTRALSLVGSDEPVMRETLEPAAMIIRLAPSFLRFGSFEYFHYKNDVDSVRQLADFTLRHYYPELLREDEPYVAFYREVATRTMVMVAAWQAVGFSHGVMNTDNMSILGLTLDYGPFGFMEAFDSGYICNHSDTSGRYAFDNQPGIAVWNLMALAEALSSLIPIEAAQEVLHDAQAKFNEAYIALMRKKLGLVVEDENDTALIASTLDMLQAAKVDYTIFFRRLSTAPHTLSSLVNNQQMLDAWMRAYHTRLSQENLSEEARLLRMQKSNPKYILRNYLAENAIRKAEDEQDYSETQRLFTCLQNPYGEQPEYEPYAAPSPEWAQELYISCSS